MKRVVKLFPENKFIEIYLSTSLEVCEKRDVKGLYKKNREVMTGIGSPYEPPDNPDLTFDTNDFTVEQIVKKVYKIREKERGLPKFESLTKEYQACLHESRGLMAQINILLNVYIKHY